MAVLVLEMIDARASGVIYSRDPAQASADTLIIHTIWGLGEMLVNGRVTPSVITVSRERPHQIEQREDTIQAVKAVSAAAGGIQTVAGDDDQTSSLALTETTTRLLAEWAVKLEAFHGNAQDIEWCMDQLGELYILQSRPLQLDQTDRQVVDCADIEVDNPVLLSGGVKACGGIGAGVVHRVAVGADLESLPEGAVLVASTPSPDYVKVMGKLNAVVTDGGSAAGHFASVAREFGVPTLVNTGSATKRLSQGREVTVNTHGRIVYEGRVQQLLESACAARSLLAGSPFMERMTKILDHVSPLNLVDPTAVNFAPGGCRTLHDILRFCHEKSVHEMFSLGDRGGRRAKGAKKLVSDIPITVHLLDLDGGLRPEAKLKKEVDIDDIASGPFRAVWKGLSNPGIYWDPTLKHFDWQEFDRISAGIVNIDKLGSYAIISKDYLNVNIHFGYHFVVLDTLCGDQLDNNYIMLRFTGGGADFASRMLRIEFLGEVLFHYGFEVEKKGDLIDAQLSREVGKTLEKKLEAIGILLGCTRLLDMALKDGSDVDRLVKKYMSGEYDLSPISRK
jgi:pyruvate,water dikinase